MSVLSNSRSGVPTVLATMTVLMSGLVIANPAHCAPTVPWLNQPAAHNALAAPAGAVGAQPCASADLRITAGVAGAYRGQATQEIRIANTGAAACHLIGFPNVQLLPANESPQTVAASEGAPQLANQRIDLAPGDEAMLLIGTPGVCEAANKPQRHVSRQLKLALPGGGVKTLDGVHVDTLCGRATVMQFQVTHNEAAAGARAAKTAGGLDQLTGSVSAPDDATRGGTLHYTVTLSNPTANAVALSPCPAYTQSLYADGKAADSSWRLNCGGAGAQIGPNASVSFEMRAPVPADMAGGILKLSWKLQDGPGVGKLINLR